MANVTPQSRSWQLSVNASLCERITSIVTGDLNGSGGFGLVVAVRPLCSQTERPPPSVYIVPFSEVTLTDAVDGEQDGNVNIENVVGRPHAYQLTLETDDSGHWPVVSLLVDLDGANHIDIGIGVSRRSVGDITAAGVAYLVSTVDLSNADAVDGHSNGKVELSDVIEQPHSWKVLGTTSSELMGLRIARRSDTELVLGTRPRTFVLSLDDLDEIDAMDGEIDATLASDRILTASNALNIQYIDNVRFTPDVDGDGDQDLYFLLNGKIYLASAELLEAYDAQDGAADGDIDGWNIARDVSTWSLRRSRYVRLYHVSSAGDIDSDSLIDILIVEKAPWNDRTSTLPNVLLVFGADLHPLDRVDLSQDRDILLGNVAGDTDEDGIVNTLDRDDDDDGITDAEDAFPA